MPEEKKKKIFDFSLLKRVFRYAAPYKKRLYLSVLLSILLAVLSPLRPFLIQVTINDYIRKGAAPGLSLKQRMEELIIWVTVLQIVLLLIETVARFYFSFITAWLGQTVVRDLRIDVYKKILGLNLSQFDKTPIGTLTTRTINDIEAINDIFFDGLIPIIADLLSILSVLLFMFLVDWRLTLVCLAPFPFLLLATWLFKESVNKSFIRVRNAVAALNAFVQEHITGMPIVQAFAAEQREDDKFNFAYIGDRYVLKNISFAMQPGQTVAIVGHTGSGKTSIISLMNRLYHIQEGEIRIDDVPIENYQLDVLRRSIGVVLQDVFLFSGSVVDNITHRNQDISIEN